MSRVLSTLQFERYAKSQIDRHRLISFDVFDTLLARSVSHPTDVFGLVRLRLLGHAPARIARIVDAFPELRVRAERLAREGAPPDRYREVTFDEVYDAFQAMTQIGADCLALLRDEELAMERRLVYPNATGKRLFDYASSQRKAIVLISDMYLPTAQIETLLAQCGYRGYDALYVSSEMRASKHGGGAFALIERNFEAALGQPLHIGDNLHGDYVMPLAAGWSATHLPATPAAREATVAVDFDSVRGATVHSAVHGLLAKRTEPPEHEDAWHALGFEVFGPLVAGFAIWLAKNMRARKPAKALYLARDAHFVKSLMEKFLPERRDDEYVFVSRGSLLLPSFTDFSLDRLVHLVSGRTRLSVRRHLTRLGIAADATANVVRSAGFDGLDDLAENGDRRMVALLGKLHRELLLAASSRRALVRRYLAQCIGDARNVAVVDIGWSGNMQGAIGRLVDDVRFDGLYVGLWGNAARGVGGDHTLRAWLATTFSSETAALWSAGGIEILEFALGAPHGTTLGYREADGRIVPELEANDLSAAESASLTRLQAGAARFVDDVLATYGDMLDALDSPAWAEPFLRMIADPTKAEAQLLGEMSHGDVAGDTSVRTPLAPLAVSDEDAARLFAACSWKRGFLRRNALSEDERFSESLYLEHYPDVRAAVEAGTIASARVHYESFGKHERRIGTWAELW